MREDDLSILEDDVFCVVILAVLRWLLDITLDVEVASMLRESRRFMFVRDVDRKFR